MPPLVKLPRSGPQASADQHANVGGDSRPMVGSAPRWLGYHRRPIRLPAPARTHPLIGVGVAAARRAARVRTVSARFPGSRKRSSFPPCSRPREACHKSHGPSWRDGTLDPHKTASTVPMSDAAQAHYSPAASKRIRARSSSSRATARRSTWGTSRARSGQVR